MRLKLAAVGLLALLAATLWLNRDWPRHWRINQHGVRARGWVIGKADPPSGLVHYAYRGPRKVHTATGRPGSGTPPYGDLKEGDEVVVYFLPDQPDVSILGTPDERLLAQHTVMVWTLLLGCGAFFWAFRRELRRQSS